MSEQELNVMELLQRMQQQLTYLEKKIDTLIQQSQPKPFNREGNFSKPFRPFNRPARPDQGRGPGYGPGRGPQHGNFVPKKKHY